MPKGLSSRKRKGKSGIVIMSRSRTSPVIWREGYGIEVILPSYSIHFGRFLEATSKGVERVFYKVCRLLDSDGSLCIRRLVDSLGSKVLWGWRIPKDPLVIAMNSLVRLRVTRHPRSQTNWTLLFTCDLLFLVPPPSSSFSFFFLLDPLPSLSFRKYFLPYYPTSTLIKSGLG